MSMLFMQLGRRLGGGQYMSGMEESRERVNKKNKVVGSERTVAWMSEH